MNDEKMENTQVENEPKVNIEPPIAPIINNDNNNLDESINNKPTPLQTVSEIIGQNNEVKEESNVVAPTPVQEQPVVEQPVVTQPQPEPVPQPVQPEPVPQPVQPVVEQPVQQNVVNPNGAGVNQEVIPSITTGPVVNNNINGVNDQTNIGFVSTGAPLKKKKNPVVVAITVISILLILGVAGYFFVYPFVMDKFFSKPKTVFTNVIKEVTNKANNSIVDLVHDKGTLDINLDLDTNLSNLSNYTDYTYGIRLGIDKSSNSKEVGYLIKDHNARDSLSNYYYFKNNSYYTKYSTYRDLIYLTDIDNDTEKLFEISSIVEDYISRTNNDDAKYIVNKVSNSFIDSLDESKMSKEEFSYVVNNQAVKATRNKYVMDKGTIDNTINKIIDDLCNDDKSVSALSSILGVEKDQVKDKLKENIEIPDDANLTLCIITDGYKMNVLGFEASYNDNFNLTYYTNNSNFDINIKTKNTINGETKEKVIVINGVKDNDKTNVSVKVDDKNVASFVISVWNDDRKTFDYSILDVEGKTINGSIDYVRTKTDKDFKLSIDFKINQKDNGTKEVIYLNAKLDLLFDWTSEVANINTNSAKTVSQEELDNIVLTYKQLLVNTPIGPLFSTIGGDVDPDIDYDIVNPDEYTEEIIDGI